MQYINKAVSSLFTCLKAQSIHSPETWDSALDFSSFSAIKILDRVANDSKLKFDRTAVLYVKYVVDTNESQTLPCISVSYYFLSDGGSPPQRSTRRYNPRSRVRSHFMHLSMLSRWGGRPGIGGAFELSWEFPFKCPTPGHCGLSK